MSRLRLGLCALACLIVFPGCTLLSRPADLSPELKTAYDTPLYCTGEAECKSMWERANYYVANESSWKLDVQNENLIATESPTRGSYGLAYRITREPAGEGRHRIATTAWCGLPEFRCKPHADEGIARAKHYIRTGIR